MTYDNSLGDTRLSDDMNVALFRILQEALTNICLLYTSDAADE